MKLAAVLLGLMAAWRLFASALPAFVAGSPGAFFDFLDVALPLFVAWGLWTLRRWAWWLAVIAAVAGCVIPALLLGVFPDVVGGDVPDPRLLARFLTVVGVISVIELALLFSPSARAAFRASAA